jgi:hypothetical protein
VEASFQRIVHHFKKVKVETLPRLRGGVSTQNDERVKIMWDTLQQMLDAAKASITWGPGLPLERFQQDAMFYKDTASFVAQVKLGDFVCDVYCDGETRVKNRMDGGDYRDGTALIAAGFDTDGKLQAMFESGDLYCDMNSWFDLYIDGEHIDSVTHEIEEAIGSAIAFLQDEQANALAIENS